MWNASLIDGPIAIDGVDGYHLNVAREIVTEALAPYEVRPATPARIFAGDAPDGEGVFQITAFLHFTDEAEAKEALAEYWTDEA